MMSYDLGIPSRLRDPFKAEYLKKISKKNSRTGSEVEPANFWARTFVSKIKGFDLAAAYDDDTIKKRAERYSRECGQHIGQGGFFAGVAFCRKHHIEPPTDRLDDERMTQKAAIARMSCPMWWRRRLRKLHGRAVETAARELNQVHKRKQPYCSDVSVKRVQQQTARNIATLQAMQAVNELGAEISLEDLHNASIANPVIRRSELMTRIRGMEEWAKSQHYKAEFVTITAPSRMHKHKSRSGDQVKNYDGSSPRDVNHYLQAVWQRIRAQLHRDGLPIMGMRVTEPHHDGTPHAHLLVFFPAWSSRMRSYLRRVFWKYAMQDAPDEIGARKNRVKFKAINMMTGSAASYLAKYVSKSVDGFAVEKDLLGNNAEEAARRVVAWSRTWGIRQFQFFGGVAVGLWREFRRAEGVPNESGLGELFKAADAADFGGFMAAFFGAKHKPELLKTWSDHMGMYGEPKGYKVAGILADGVFVNTRPHVWKIKLQGEKVADSGARSPWSPVNNCTRRGENDDYHDRRTSRGTAKKSSICRPKQITSTNKNTC